VGLRSSVDYVKRMMTCNKREFTVLMENKETVANSQSSNQTVNGAADRRPSLSQVPINIGSVLIIGGMCTILEKRKRNSLTVRYCASSLSPSRITQVFSVAIPPPVS